MDKKEEKKDSPEIPQTAKDFINECGENKEQFMIFHFHKKGYIGAENST